MSAVAEITRRIAFVPGVHAGQFKIPAGRELLRESLSRLEGPGAPAGELEDSALAAGPESLALWYLQLRRLASKQKIQISVFVDDKPVATLRPISESFRYEPDEAPPSAERRLSRFAHLRRVGDELWLESPRAFARVLLHEETASRFFFSLLSSRGVPSDALERELFALFAQAGMLASDDEGSWEFHDLLFHSRSRLGRHDQPAGAVFPLAATRPAPPALKPAMTSAGNSLELAPPAPCPKADLFSDLLSERKSWRRYGASPITRQQLGDLLFRVARVKDGVQARSFATPHGPREMELAERPYPAGGALHELEIYPVVQSCAGLAAGIYHYQPLRHALEPIESTAEGRQELLNRAAFSSGIAPASLQVLLIVTARHERLAWKYASISYALTLKHVGVLYQTLYLAATAMELAPCAIGTGDSDAFARAAGLDYETESAVGEFLLGSRE